MKRTNSMAFLLLFVGVMLTGLSCSKPGENKREFSPAPRATSPVPSVGTTSKADIKGEPGMPQTVDIISGKPVIKSVYTDYDGERVYFCCAQSKSDFQKNPQFYIEKIRARGIILERTP